MDAYLTWKYFVIPEDKFDQIKDLEEELNTLCNKELDDEQAVRKEMLIDMIDKQATPISEMVMIFKDSENAKDGTIMEELVYRMDEAPELRKYTEPDEFYFPFMVRITPDGLQKQYAVIEKIFEVTSEHDLLKQEFLGDWVYLERAKAIFVQIVDMFKTAYEKKCGIIKIDKLDWIDDAMVQKEEEVLEEVESDIVDA
ncbi:MAG: hypothetical protein LWY06_03040 [Firmicutes bacterium]|nr:hypothetical protein [Bacillota bacterium]